MIRIVLFTLSITLATVTAAMGTRIDDLELFGAGEAYYLKFIKVYKAALYAEGSAAPENILQTDVSKCLLLEYEVGVKKKDFVKAADTILRRQFTDDDLLQVQKEIERLHNSYKDVKSGDTYNLCYNAEAEVTTLHHNGREEVQIPSGEFAKVYFSIWLGNEQPLDSTLRDNLLAKKRKYRRGAAALMDNFLSTYKILNGENLYLLNNIYTDDVRFIDPAHEIHGLDQLRTYFMVLYDNVESIGFDFHDVLTVGNQGYVQWDMTLKHPKIARGNPTTVAGTTYVRLHTNGKALFHRDYFDLGAMLYEHLPLVGRLISTVKRRLGQ